MDTTETTTAAPNDPAPELFAQSLGHATATLTAALPNPRPNTEAARTARDTAAICQVAALIPVNPAETMFAVQLVAANAQGLECQAVAQGHGPDRAHVHLRDAAMMMRVAQGAARTLLRLQAARQRREATSQSCHSATLTEHCTQQTMLAALARQTREREDAARQVAEQQAVEAAARALPPPPPPEPEPITEDDITAAEAYAQSSPANQNRARIIRRKGCMPNWGMFEPPADAVVRALAFGQSPILNALLPQAAP